MITCKLPIFMSLKTPPLPLQRGHIETPNVSAPFTFLTGVSGTYLFQDLSWVFRFSTPWSFGSLSTDVTVQNRKHPDGLDTPARTWASMAYSLWEAVLAVQGMLHDATQDFLADGFRSPHISVMDVAQGKYALCYKELLPLAFFYPKGFYQIWVAGRGTLELPETIRCPDALSLIHSLLMKVVSRDILPRLSWTSLLDMIAGYFQDDLDGKVSGMVSPLEWALAPKAHPDIQSFLKYNNPGPRLPKVSLQVTAPEVSLVRE